METSFIDDRPVPDFNLDEIDENGEKVKTIALCFVKDMMGLLRKVQKAWKQVNGSCSRTGWVPLQSLYAQAM